MGHIYAQLNLANPRDASIVPLQVQALADTGALMLCIPEHLALQLQLETVELREVTLADGRCVQVPYVGPVDVGFGKRRCFTGALVLGDEVLLGAVPMEDMDLVLNPARQCVTVNPLSPNVPHSRVKRQQGVLRANRTSAGPIAEPARPVRPAPSYRECHTSTAAAT